MLTKNKAPDPIFQKAVEWIIRLEDDPAIRTDFEAWCAADQRHAAAAEKLQGFLSRVQALNKAPPAQASAVRQTVSTTLAAAKRKPRASARRVMLLAALVLLPASLGLKFGIPAYLLADYRSGSTWRQLALEDGTQVSLSQDSAFNFSTDNKRRVLHLIKGEVKVQVAHDERHPFFVHTDEADIRSLGTRFIVTRGQHHTILAMLESRTALTPTHSADKQPLYLVAGQQATVDDTGQTQVSTINPQLLEQGWQAHQLIALDQPLAEVLATLARHHAGLLSFDPAALDGVRVSAVLPLDDSMQAMKLLGASLPNLKIDSFTSYWIRVSWASPTQTTGSPARP